MVRVSRDLGLLWQGDTASLVPRLSPQKTGGGESLVTSAGKVVDLQRLALAVQITNQIAERNHVYTWHFVNSAKYCQLKNELISADCISKVDEKQFLDVQKGSKSRDSKVEVHCSWFTGPTRSSYFTAPSLHVQSVSRNSAALQHACVHASIVLGWSEYSGTYDLVWYNSYTFLRISMPFDGVTGHPSLLWW